MAFASQSSDLALLLAAAIPGKRAPPVVAATTDPGTDGGVGVAAGAAVDVPARCSGASALTRVKDAAPATTEAIVPPTPAPALEPPPLVVSMLESLVSIVADVA